MHRAVLGSLTDQPRYPQAQVSATNASIVLAWEVQRFSLMSSTDDVDLSSPCAHTTAQMPRHVHRPPRGCEECLKTGSWWVHLRVCLSCGHVGCCDSSPNRHATAHYRATDHPVITSGEVGETWAYCYPDDRVLSDG